MSRQSLPALLLFTAALAAPAALAQAPMTIDDLARIRGVAQIVPAPDGRAVAHTVSVPRDVLAGEENGSSRTELHVAFGPDDVRTYVSGDDGVSALAWTPDGKRLSFLSEREDDDHSTLYAIPLAGGEAARVFAHDTGISSYAWTPDGEGLWFVALEEEDATQKQLSDKGFNARVFEEAPRYARVWHVDLSADEPEAEALELEGHASSIALSDDGSRLAVVLAPTPYVDDSYMNARVHIVDTRRERVIAEVATPGKIGGFAFSPSGEQLALLAGMDRSDPAPVTLMLVDTDSGEDQALLPGVEADVVDFVWRDEDTLAVLRHRSTASELALVDVSGNELSVSVHEGFVGSTLSRAHESDMLVLRAGSPGHPAEVYAGDAERGFSRWTRHNAWTDDIELANQRVYRYATRDGVEVDGLLIEPDGRRPRDGWPLIMVVHGGPESHYVNNWVTGYSEPGQIAAGEGFAVFYPNYRGSTGRGVAFAKLDHADPPGDEFYDLVDGIAALAAEGIVDPERVGITGGSYGGFASAWGATIGTEHFAAAVAFVSLTNLVSFGGTTDIPEEMTISHFRTPLWEDWQLFLEKSPVYHAGKSRTATLILHGEADPRVHPSQSLELYRHLSQRTDTPVRLVTYPGEGHGNSRAAARIDYAHRLMRWMTHYLDGPGGEPPPPDIGIAERLGIKTEQED